MNGWETMAGLLEGYGVPRIATFLVAKASSGASAWRNAERVEWIRRVEGWMEHKRRGRSIILERLANAWPCAPRERADFTLMAGGRWGKMSVPPERRATFFRQLWGYIHTPWTAMSVIECKPSEGRWRLKLDIDLKGPGMTLADVKGAQHYIDLVVGALAVAYADYPSFRADVVWGPLRLQAGSAGLAWKAGVHVNTNAIVDEANARVVQGYLADRLDLPPWLDVDGPVSFGTTGMRVDGCWKVGRCPDHHPTACDRCGHSNLILGAPPYPAGDDYDDWTRRLLWCGDEPVWELFSRSQPDDSHAGRVAAGMADKRRRLEAQRQLADRHVRQCIRDADDIPGLRPTDGDRVQPRQEAIDAAALALPRWHADLEPVRVVALRDGRYFIHTALKRCPFVGRVHSKSTLYVVALKRTGLLKLRCRSHWCKGRETKLPPIPALHAALWPDLPPIPARVVGLFDDF